MDGWREKKKRRRRRRSAGGGSSSPPRGGRDGGGGDDDETVEVELARAKRDVDAAREEKRVLEEKVTDLNEIRRGRKRKRNWSCESRNQPSKRQK